MLITAQTASMQYRLSQIELTNGILHDSLFELRAQQVEAQQPIN